MGRELRRLPDRALGHLAVAQQGVDPRPACCRACAPRPCRPRRTGPGRASRWPRAPRAPAAWGGPRAGCRYRRSVSRSSSIAPASFKRGPEDRRRVALGEDEHVGVVAARVARIEAHLVEEEDRHDLGADMQLVGWPEPASVVDSREWRRSFCAIRARVEASTGMEGSRRDADGSAQSIFRATTGSRLASGDDLRVEARRVLSPRIARL